MPNIALPVLALFLCALVAAQAMLVRDLSSETDTGSATSKYNHQLYELYKIMRLDPNLASVSNNELLLYIYRNFVTNRQPNMMQLMKKPQAHFQSK